MTYYVKLIDMPNVYFMLIHFLYLGALCCWIGGTLAIPLWVIPTMQRELEQNQDLHELVDELLARLQKIALICAFFLVVSAGIKLKYWETLSWPISVRYMILTVVILSLLFAHFISYPQVVRYRPKPLPEHITPLDTATNPKLIKWRWILQLNHSINLIGGLGVLFLS